jgi:hypothetical protein
MALEISFTSHVMVVTTVGDVDFEEGLATLKRGLLEAQERVARRMNRRWPILFDLRQSTERRTGEEIKGIAHFLGQYRAVLDGGCAIVVRGAVYYGLSRMFGAYVSPFGLEVRVFSEVAEAEKWLLSREAHLVEEP